MHIVGKTTTMTTTRILSNPPSPTSPASVEQNLKTFKAEQAVTNQEFRRELAGLTAKNIELTEQVVR